MATVSMRNHPLPLIHTQQIRNQKKIHTQTYYTAIPYNTMRRRVL